MAIVGRLSFHDTLETFRDLTEELDKEGLLIHTMGRSALESYFMALSGAAGLYTEDVDQRQQFIEHLSRPGEVEVERRVSGPSTSVRAIVLGSTAAAAASYLSVGLRHDRYTGDPNFYPTRLSVSMSYATPTSSYTASKNWWPPFLLPAADGTRQVGMSAKKMLSDDLRLAFGIVRHFNDMLQPAVNETLARRLTE